MDGQGSTFMSFTGPVEDRLAIRELIDTYNDAVALRDADAWGATWAQDAQWDLMGAQVVGREAIVALWQQTMAQLEIVVFQTAPGAVEIQGNDATGRVFASEILQPKGGDLRRVYGRYDDTYAKSVDGWQFAARRYRVLSAF